MTEANDGVVSVTRRIEAPVTVVFALLVDSRNHPRFDGSGMLRNGSADATISAVGDVFTMKMYNDEMGDYEMANHVVDYEVDRRVVWEPVLSAASRAEDMTDVGQRAGHRWGYNLEPDGDATMVTEIFDCSRSPVWLREAVNDGNNWLTSMAATLDLLEQECDRSCGPGLVAGAKPKV